MFSIDGKEYDVSILFIPEEGIERKFNILDGNNAGRLQAKGKMYRDIIGTFFTYVIKIDTNRLDPQEYDELYEMLKDGTIQVANDTVATQASAVPTDIVKVDLIK